MLDTLTNLGFYDFLLPWLLFVAVFFGLLQTKKTISEDAAVNGVIAIVAAFLVAYIAKGMLYTRIFGTFGVIAAGFLILIIALAMFGIKPEDLFGEKNKGVLSIALGIVILMVFLSAGGLDAFGTAIDSDTLATVVILLVMVAAIAFIGGGKKD